VRCNSERLHPLLMSFILKKKIRRLESAQSHGTEGWPWAIDPSSEESVFRDKCFCASQCSAGLRHLHFNRCEVIFRRCAGLATLHRNIQIARLQAPDQPDGCACISLPKSCFIYHLAKPFLDKVCSFKQEKREYAMRHLVTLASPRRVLANIRCSVI
jgi:hypothetical protein